MNKDEIIRMIYGHFEDKDVGIAMLGCISEPEQVDALASKLEQLILSRVSGSALLNEAKQIQKENQHLIDNATVNADREHKEAIKIGIDRIVKLIERHYL